MPHGFRDVRSLNLGGTVTYACYYGYNMVGNEAIQCQTNGTWTPKPTCDLIPSGWYSLVNLSLLHTSCLYLWRQLSLINGAVLLSPFHETYRHDFQCACKPKCIFVSKGIHPNLKSTGCENILKHNRVTLQRL